MLTPGARPKFRFPEVNWKLTALAFITVFPIGLLAYFGARWLLGDLGLSPVNAATLISVATFLPTAIIGSLFRWRDQLARETVVTVAFACAIPFPRGHDPVGFSEMWPAYLVLFLLYLGGRKVVSLRAGVRSGNAAR